MNELVKIEKTELNGELKQTVNARELHEFLESKRQFSNWIGSKIEQFGFIEGEDFLTNLFKTPSTGRPLKEYFLTLDMAKQLCMVENNDKGREARLYFIDCEKQIRQVINQQKPLTTLQMIAQIAQEASKQEERLSKVERQLVETEQNVRRQVKASLAEEQINIFPRGCIDLPTIRQKYFQGISESNISTFLQNINHPQKEYKRLIKGNEIRHSLVFSEDGLAMAYKRLLEESFFIKETPLNLNYSHSVIGNFRIKKRRYAA